MTLAPRPWKNPKSTSETHLELESNIASAHPTFQSPCHPSQLVTEAGSLKLPTLHQNLWVQIPSFALHGVGCDHMAQKRMHWCLHNQNTRGSYPRRREEVRDQLNHELNSRDVSPLSRSTMASTTTITYLCQPPLHIQKPEKKCPVLFAGTLESYDCKTSRELLMLCQRHHWHSRANLCLQHPPTC